MFVCEKYGVFQISEVNISDITFWIVSGIQKAFQTHYDASPKYWSVKGSLFKTGQWLQLVFTCSIMTTNVVIIKII